MVKEMKVVSVPPLLQEAKKTYSKKMVKEEKMITSVPLISPISKKVVKEKQVITTIEAQISKNEVKVKVNCISINVLSYLEKNNFTYEKLYFNCVR